MEQTLIDHLTELRTRLIRVLISVLVIFLCLFCFSNEIYYFLAQPLLKHLPAGSKMIATEVASPFLAPTKLVATLSFFLAVPYILYQVWGFVAPGLYAQEKRIAFPLLLSSIILFYIGACFAYFAVFPMVFGFFTHVAPMGVAIMTDISHYLNFILTFFLVFGLTFEIPVVVFVLVMAGVIAPQKLKAARPYVLIGAFFIGMILTPPDVFSQTLLAIPMYLLFEVGLLVASKAYNARLKRMEEGCSPNCN